MYYSIKGKVVFIENKFIVVETGGIGYEILVSKPSSYLIGEEISLYLHHEIKQDDEYLAGFHDTEERDAFNLLLRVNGIGPKSALTILSHVKANDLLVAISNNDLEFVEHIEGLSPRQASQIILDLKEYIAKNNKENQSKYKEIKDALKALKFKVKDIDRVLPGIYIPNATNDQIIKEALRRLSYAKNL